MSCGDLSETGGLALDGRAAVQVQTAVMAAKMGESARKLRHVGFRQSLAQRHDRFNLPTIAIERYVNTPLAEWPLQSPRDPSGRR
jgi:hypothetical protein